MRFRKLRIAWSVTWGVACIALVAFWVRSYSTYDFWHWPIASQLKVNFQSRPGHISISRLPTVAEFQAAAAEWGQSAANIKSVHLGNVNFRALHIGNAVVIDPTLAISIVKAPYWSLCVFAAVTSGAAWLPWSRRFSLRTLLIATTLVAVGLGVIVWMSRGG